jgi:hypothetical protein
MDSLNTVFTQTALTWKERQSRHFTYVIQKKFAEIAGGKEAEGVREHGVEENICT